MSGFLDETRNMSTGASSPISQRPFACGWVRDGRLCSLEHPETARFGTREELKIHVETHLQNEFTESATLLKTWGYYFCYWRFCAKIFREDTGFEEHVEKHTQQLPFMCPLCDRARFNSPNPLRKHLVAHHADRIVEVQDSDIGLKDRLQKCDHQNSYKCPLCDHGRFGSPKTLKKHLLSEHATQIVDSTGKIDITNIDDWTRGTYREEPGFDCSNLPKGSREPVNENMEEIWEGILKAYPSMFGSINTSDPEETGEGEHHGLDFLFCYDD